VLVLLVHHNSDMRPLYLICFLAVSSISDGVGRERYCLMNLMVIASVHHIALIDAMLRCYLRQVLQRSLKLADKAGSMPVVLLDVRVAVIDLRILIESRLRSHKELLGLWVMTEHDRRRSVILHREIAAMATSLHMLVSVHQRCMSVLESLAAMKKRTILCVMNML